MRKSIPFLFLLFCALASFSAPKVLAASASQTSVAEESIFNLASVWTNQDGKKINLSSLRGEPIVVAMIYTGCRGACPLTVSDMQRIENGLPAELRSKVHFVLISFDSMRDTPKSLRMFQRMHRLDSSNWNLLTGRPLDVRKVAAMLGVHYKEQAPGVFSHSSDIAVIDSQGVIKYRQIGLGRDPGPSIQILSSISGE